MTKKITLKELARDFPTLYQNTKKEPEIKSAGAKANPQRRRILDWARDHGMIIHPASGYSYYVDGYQHFGCCPCDKNRPGCPCPESITEVKEQGHCKCRLFWRDLDTFKHKFIPGET